MAHPDILDSQESLRGPFLRSLAAHGALLAAMAGWVFWRTSGNVNPFGDPNPGGGMGAIEVTAASIPIPNRSPRKNPVANDTESQVRQTPRKERVDEAPDPDAISLDRKKRKQKPKFDLKEYSRNRVNQQEEELENQLTSDKGARASSPLFQVPGTGSIGIGANAPMGGRFGYYVTLIQQCVGMKWREQNVGAQTAVSGPAVIRFDILRNGEVRDAAIQQSSGNAAVDRASHRAVLNCSPFQPLPAQYEGRSASVEFWFRIQQ